MSKNFPFLFIAASVFLPVLSFGQVEIRLTLDGVPVGIRVNAKANAKCACGLIIAPNQGCAVIGSGLILARALGPEMKVDVPHGREQSAEYLYLGGEVRFNEPNPLR